MLHEVTACHNCTIGPGKACLACKRINQDDIRIAHRPHLTNRSAAVIAAATPHTSERALPNVMPEDDEDALRQFLATIAGLDAPHLLALLHFARRGSHRTLAESFRTFAASIRMYDATAKSRASIFMTIKAIIKDIPQLSSLYAAKRSGK